MAFMAVLESDLRALSAEARRRYPAVKDGAEHAIIKVSHSQNSSSCIEFMHIIGVAGNSIALVEK